MSKVHHIKDGSEVRFLEEVKVPFGYDKTLSYEIDTPIVNALSMISVYQNINLGLTYPLTLSLSSLMNYSNYASQDEMEILLNRILDYNWAIDDGTMGKHYLIDFTMPPASVAFCNDLAFNYGIDAFDLTDFLYGLFIQEFIDQYNGKENEHIQFVPKTFIKQDSIKYERHKALEILGLSKILGVSCTRILGTEKEILV